MPSDRISHGGLSFTLTRSISSISHCLTVEIFGRVGIPGVTRVGTGSRSSLRLERSGFPSSSLAGSTTPTQNTTTDLRNVHKGVCHLYVMSRVSTAILCWLSPFATRLHLGHRLHMPTMHSHRPSAGGHQAFALFRLTLLAAISLRHTAIIIEQIGTVDMEDVHSMRPEIGDLHINSRGGVFSCAESPDRKGMHALLSAHASAGHDLELHEGISKRLQVFSRYLRNA